MGCTVAPARRVVRRARGGSSRRFLSSETHGNQPWPSRQVPGLSGLSGAVAVVLTCMRRVYSCNNPPYTMASAMLDMHEASAFRVVGLHLVSPERQCYRALEPT